MTVHNNDPRPAYAQVADALRTAIRDRKLSPGERLPSGRELAAQHGVAMMTIQKSLDVLRREGLVVSQQGRGVFVSATGAETPVDELAQLRTSVENLSRRLDEVEARLGQRADD